MTLLQLKKKLAIGTAQLGLTYGINNKRGKPSQAEADRILATALNHNIRMLDSADAYGNSLQVIGSFLSRNGNAGLEIINKFVEDDKPIIEKFKSSIGLLGSKNLYAYMFHRFEDYKRRNSMMGLLQLKEMGRITKIGVSVYEIDQLNMVVQDPEVDLVQIPFNCLDATIEKRDLMAEAKSRNKEVHVRSVFLQGLFFKSPYELTGTIRGLQGTLSCFHETVRRHSLTVMQACLNFALHNPYVDKVIVGIETVDQLEENLRSIFVEFPNELIAELESIEVADRSLLNPSNWRLN